MGLGGEMGIYTRNEQLGYLGYYDAADFENYMSMSFSFYVSDSTTPVFTRYDPAHWWLNGFVPGYEGVSASDIRMIGSITLHDKCMVEPFTNSLPSNIKYTVNGLRVDFDWQYTKLVDLCYPQEIELITSSLVGKLLLQ